MDRLEQKVLSFIRENGLAPRGARILTALSGGADSVCLLLMLRKLCGVLGIRVSAMHVNHGLRGEEADRDEAFCRALCERLQVPFRSERADVRREAAEAGEGIEEAARNVRYRLLFAERERMLSGSGEGACPGVFIACAHHADDQAETILLNLLRGSGLKGLAGMRPGREDGVIRPLLCIGREEILRYLEANGQDYVTDSTNLVNDNPRNYIRNVLLPGLKEHVNAQAAGHLALAGGIAREADSWLEEEARRFIREHAAAEVRVPGRDDVKGILLPRRILKEKPQILRRYVIIEALNALKVPLKDWSETHFSDMDRALAKQSGTHLDLPCGVTLENTREETWLIRKGGGSSGDTEGTRQEDI